MTRLKTLRLGIALGSFLFAGCAQTPPPEPQIRTVTVNVPVPVPCPALKRIGPPPAYPDTNAAILAAPDLAMRVGLLLAGRVLRMARGDADEAALQACAAPVQP